MNDSIMNGAPPQAVGFSNAKGWTDSDHFLKWLEHSACFTNSTKETPHLIVLDGHHSHNTLAATIFYCERGIHMIISPLHSTNKLQLLDRAYFKSLKSA